MSNCAYTQGFPLDCSRDKGGISVVYIAPLTAKGNLQIVSGSVANTGSFLISGSLQQFYTINLRKETGEATEDYQIDDTNNSAFYAQTVSFPLYRGDINKTNEIKLYANQSSMIIVKDFVGPSGSYTLYGSDTGLDLSGGFKSGKAAKDGSVYSLTFKGSEVYPRVFIPGATMAALLLPA